MSKVAIFLCAALIASAVNASYVSDALVSAEARLEGLIESTVKTTKEKFDDIKSKAAENIAQFEIDVKAAGEEGVEEIKSSFEKAKERIYKLCSDEKSVDCTECNKFASELEKIGQTLVANMSTCVDDKLATGHEYVQNINRLSENVLSNLTKIRDEARHCSDNVDSVKDAASAVACTNLAALKVAWIETKGVPSVLIEMGKIRYLIVTLQPSLVFCRVANGIVAFYQEWSIILEKSEQCIAQKKREHASRSEQVPTEKNHTAEEVPTEKSPSAEEVRTEKSLSTEKALSPEPTANPKDASA